MTFDEYYNKQNFSDLDIFIELYLKKQGRFMKLVETLTPEILKLKDIKISDCIVRNKFNNWLIQSDNENTIQNINGYTPKLNKLSFEKSKYICVLPKEIKK